MPSSTDMDYVARKMNELYDALSAQGFNTAACMELTKEFFSGGYSA